MPTDSRLMAPAGAAYAVTVDGVERTYIHVNVAITPSGVLILEDAATGGLVAAFPPGEWGACEKLAGGDGDEDSLESSGV